MIRRGFLASVSCLLVSIPLCAQLTRDARYEIIRNVLAVQASARIGLPFGGEGVELTDAGKVNEAKLAQEIKKNGQSIEIGKVVTLTEITFDDKTIEIQLDGGGKNKKNILDHISVGMGGAGGSSGRPVGDSDDELKKAKGSKIVLRFANKIAPDLSPDQLRKLLDPVLDFEKHNFLQTGIDALSPEFREAVKLKEARIGMDRSTVLMALGRPDNRIREKDEADGLTYETWLYRQRGYKTLFVTFNEDLVVVKIKQY